MGYVSDFAFLIHAFRCINSYLKRRHSKSLQIFPKLSKSKNNNNRLLLFPYPLKVGKDLKVERNVRERDHYLKDFRFPRKENNVRKVEKNNSKIGNYTHTNKNHERQWENKVDKPRTTNC